MPSLGIGARQPEHQLHTCNTPVRTCRTPKAHVAFRICGVPCLERDEQHVLHTARAVAARLLPWCGEDGRSVRKPQVGERTNNSMIKSLDSSTSYRWARVTDDF